MPSVGYRQRDNTHDFSLSDGMLTYYFNLAGQVKIIGEHPQTPSTFVSDDAGRNFGDWDPNMAHIEQRDWQGGRGQEDFYNDQSRYFDALHAWTFSPGRISQVPQWRFGEGYYFADVLLPGGQRSAVGNDVHWVKMLDQVQYARSFTSTAATYTSTRAMVWIRRKGMPAGTLTLEVFANSGGEPTGSALASSTVDASELGDTTSYLWEFDLGAGFAQSASTVYWVVIYSTGNDAEHSHWLVGMGDEGADTAKTSTDSGSTWSNADWQLYFRLTAAYVDRKWHFFKLDGCQYAVDQKADGTASELYLNGDRGKATAATSTTLTDSNSGVYGSAWPTNLWAGARVRILEGTGKGQHRAISSNTGTALTVSSAWSITPSTDSEYYIYSTNEWVDITPSAGDEIDGVVKSVAVFDDQAAFAQGSAVNILRMRFDPTNSPPSHEFDDDGTNKADVLLATSDPVQGPIVVRAENDTVDVSISVVKAWATALAFGDEIDVGSDNELITNLVAYNGQIWVGKEGSVWYLEGSRPRQVEIGLDSMTEGTNSIAMLVWNLNLYFTWSGSLEQLFSGSVDDIGPWLDFGLPAGRKGFFDGLDGTYAFLIGAMNAGDDGISSILAWNKRGWMELVRGWKAGRKAQGVQWQSCPGDFDRMWFSMGGEIMCQLFPQKSLNPLREDDFPFHHEFMIEFSSVDMRASRLSKMFNEVGLTTQNLGQQAWIELEYQTDNMIGTTTWAHAGTFASSDYQAIDLGLGDRRRIRYRLRGYTESSTTPIHVIAAVLEAFARTPTKFQWTMPVQINSVTLSSEGRVTDEEQAYDFLDWLKASSQRATKLHMHSAFRHMDDIDVTIEPPSTVLRMRNKYTELLQSTSTLVIRET